MHIRLLGWEDTLPGAGRPQELINEDLDTCTVFFGMLWKRWGSETGAGYSSGFEEEFERCKSRRKSSGVPEMLLAFKQIDADSLADAGPQLGKVIEFKRTQQRLREILFKEFQDTEKFTEVFHDWLEGYVAREYKRQRDENPEPPASETITPAQAPSDKTNARTPEKDRSGLPQDLLQSIDELSSAVKVGSKDGKPDLVEMSNQAVIRTNLFLKALSSSRMTGELYSTHEINLAYQERSHINPTETESGLVSRMIFADQYGLHPGWYWFRNASPDGAERAFYASAYSETDPDIRSAMVTQLKSLQIYPHVDISRNFLREMLIDSAPTIRRMAIDLIAEIGRENDFPLLEEASRSTDDEPEEFRYARLCIIARKDANRALRMALKDPGIPSGYFLQIVSSKISSVNNSILYEVLKSGYSMLRKIAVRELATRRKLTIEIARTLLLDTSLLVRETAIKSLIISGERITGDEIRTALDPKDAEYDSESTGAEDRCITALFETYSDAELSDSIDWYSSNSDIAYGIYYRRRFKAEGEKVREDLTDRFAALKRTADDRMRARFGNEADSMIEIWTNVNEYVRSKFTATALSIIAEMGSSQDLDVAQKYLIATEGTARDEVRAAAVSIIANHGSKPEAYILARLALEESGQLGRVAAKGALRLFPGPDGIVRELLKSNDETIVNLALESLTKYKPSELDALFRPLLYDERSGTRLAVLAYFVEVESKRNLVRLLKTYIADAPNGRYYYNVVCWLDRCIYAPGRIQKAYRALLNRNVRQQIFQGLVP